MRSSLVTASQTSPDSKNGMIVLLNGEEGASGKLMLASGIFPLLTKCKDKSFTELVDAIVPQNASMLKLWNLLSNALSYLKISMSKNNLNMTMRKRNELKKEKLKDTSLTLEERERLEAQQITFTTLREELYKNFLEESKAYLGEDSTTYIKMLRDPGNTNSTAPGIEEVGRMKSLADHMLVAHLKEYTSVLEGYFNALKQIEPQYEERIGEAITATKGLYNELDSEQGSVTEFKKYLRSEKSAPLRDFAHTEDILLYKLSKNELPNISPFIFSFNDMCNACRKKLPQAIRSELLPENIAYFSKIKLNRPEPPTTVDYIYTSGGPTTEDGHASIPHICQIRIPDPEVIPGNEIQITFSYDGVPSILQPSSCLIL